MTFPYVILDIFYSLESKSNYESNSGSVSRFPNREVCLELDE